jgi:hypothetical protein
MNAQEWQACADPQLMLEFLGAKVSDRKLRLFAVACCRRVAHWQPNANCRHAVDVVERFADAQAHREELEIAAAVAASDCSAIYWGEGQGTARCASAAAAAAAWLPTEKRAWHGATETALWVQSAAMHGYGRDAAQLLLGKGKFTGASLKAIDQLVQSIERGQQTLLLKDIVGCPFGHRPTIDAEWLTWTAGTIGELAQAIYSQRAFDRMAVLADALEEAGCTNAEVLDHCRAPQCHVRGCWVIDALLCQN